MPMHTSGPVAGPSGSSSSAPVLAAGLPGSIDPRYAASEAPSYCGPSQGQHLAATAAQPDAFPFPSASSSSSSFYSLPPPRHHPSLDIPPFGTSRPGPSNYPSSSLSIADTRYEGGSSLSDATTSSSSRRPSSSSGVVGGGGGGLRLPGLRELFSDLLPPLPPPLPSPSPQLAHTPPLSTPRPVRPGFRHASSSLPPDLRRRSSRDSGGSLSAPIDRNLASPHPVERSPSQPPPAR